MKVLLPIRPEYALKIFSGQKKYEYRRSIFKDRNVTRIVVYASAPMKKVIGEFEIEEILYQDVTLLWDQTNAHGGVSKEFFFDYFSDKTKGYAIKVKNVIRYEAPLELGERFNIKPPQSFAYLP